MRFGFDVKAGSSWWMVRRLWWFISHKCQLSSYYHLTVVLYCELLLCRGLTVIYSDRQLKSAARLSVCDCFHMFLFNSTHNIFQNKTSIGYKSLKGHNMVTLKHKSWYICTNLNCYDEVYSIYGGSDQYFCENCRS